MATKAQSVALQEFEPKGLALNEEVAAMGEPVILTKGEKPIAKLVRFTGPVSLVGSIIWEGDIVSPIEESWDADS